MVMANLGHSLCNSWFLTRRQVKIEDWRGHKKSLVKIMHNRLQSSLNILMMEWTNHGRQWSKFSNKGRSRRVGKLLRVHWLWTAIFHTELKTIWDLIRKLIIFPSSCLAGVLRSMYLHIQSCLRYETNIKLKGTHMPRGVR